MESCKYRRKCLCCKVSFGTNYPQKKYCGSGRCEEERRRRKARRIEEKRRGKRKEDKALYYNKTGLLS